MGGLKLQDLNWGMLNEIVDSNQSQVTGDRRRTSTSTMLQQAATLAYSPDAIGTRSEYQGFIVSFREVEYATYENPGSMLQEYVLLTNSTQPAGDDDDLQAEAGHYNNIAYKVYIPELNPQPAPRGANDPVLRSYPDIYSSMASMEKLPLGALVVVKYESPTLLRRPSIVRVVERDIIIENVSDDRGHELADAFYDGRTTTTMGGGRGQPVSEQEITGIPNIKKSNTNKDSDSYTHWGESPEMKKLLLALNAGAEQEDITLTINSALRTPYNQVRIMFQNYKNNEGLVDRAKGRKYLVDLYNPTAANAIVDAFERGNYQTEQQAGAGAGYLAAPDSEYFHLSRHQLGKAVDVAFEGAPNPKEKVAKALLAAAQANKGINILMENNHFHISYEGESTPSKFRRFGGTGGPTDAQMASVAEFGLTVGDITGTA